MALTKCRECDAVVSTQAQACPKCGAPVAGSTGETPDRTELSKWVYVVSVVVAVIIAVGVAAYYYWGPLDAERKGQLGDYFGGLLNPAFAFLSFIALLLTIWFQSKELRLSTEELAKSADALARQNATLAQQNETLLKQAFENTFFQLLRRFSDVVDHVRHHQHTARVALQSLYTGELKPIFEQYVRPQPEDAVVSAYEEFYTNARNELGHYFRTLYHIFRFVDNGPLSEEEKCRYANIARAQLSTYELCLLFYNGTCGEGKLGFKPLIEKYGLLKHLNVRDLLDASHRAVFYAETAFLSREERYAVNR